MSHGIKGETSAQGTPKGTTICGIVGVVFGALGLVLSFIPIVNNIAAILGAIGVVLAIIAMVGTFRGKKAGSLLNIETDVIGKYVEKMMQGACKEPGGRAEPAKKALTRAFLLENGF